MSSANEGKDPVFLFLWPGISFLSFTSILNQDIRTQKTVKTNTWKQRKFEVITRLANLTVTLFSLIEVLRAFTQFLQAKTEIGYNRLQIKPL
jgi:uncharacterized protein YpbB